MTRDYIKYRSGYKYQIVESYEVKVNITPEEDKVMDFVSLTADGLLTMKKGYAWDGPSGLTLDTKTFMRGSLVHDALYQLLRHEKLKPELREDADKELRRICLEDGMSKPRAWYVYKAVQKGAGFAAAPENKKKIHFAPKPPE
jgi:hypothetical protein